MSVSPVQMLTTSGESSGKTLMKAQRAEFCLCLRETPMMRQILVSPLKGTYMASCTSVFPLLPSVPPDSALLLKKNPDPSIPQPFPLGFSVLIICRLIFPELPAKILSMLLV